MLRNVLVAFFIIASACAMHLEYLKVDSEELHDGTLISATSNVYVGQDEDLLMPEEQIPGVCSICKRIMKKVKHHLGNHENAEKIKEKLMNLCDKLGPVKKFVGKWLLRTLICWWRNFLQMMIQKQYVLKLAFASQPVSQNCSKLFYKTSRNSEDAHVAEIN
ncbi:hypothetical protein HF521_021526 [Silurus meridionalis]|uniref:Saposin-like type B region 1 domain-containing protein n=1 Tax=Silurus meridionalis TaxID=175797 RepID=A0A8T0BBK6_SILME|nr:hypothetical protein HF521_021526 [Silurus meridionalis]